MSTDRTSTHGTSTEDLLVRCLAALVDGDGAAATALARSAAAAGDGSLLAHHLAAHLEADATAGGVYDQPAAFAAFIRGGGNTGLYRAVAAALAAQYEDHRTASLLDVGCGDGTALVPALALATHRPARVDLLEPSPPLLDAALAALAASGVPVAAEPLAMTAQQLVDRLDAGPDDRRWDLVESTFALHTIAPDERTDVLARLAPRAGRLAVVEFDVPDLAHGGPEHLRFLVTTYERGLAEYGDDAELVARGFLMPVLTGQLAPGAQRHTHEQPAESWRRQVAAAGWTDVVVTALHDYWSAPAFLLTARGGA